MTKSADCTVDDATEYFEYLDGLRASGAVNMFGARPYLMQKFGLDGATAMAVFTAWMHTFDQLRTAAWRAAEAFGECKP